MKIQPAMQPTLSTERLTLRPYALEDAPQVQKLAGDSLIAEMVSDIPHPYHDGLAEAWIGSHRATYEARDAIVFAVILRDTNTLIGAVSINQIFDTTANLGYWIGASYWGKGYCTEATKELIKFGFDSVGLLDLCAIHLPENPASGRVMMKTGFTYIKEVKLGDTTVLYYELVKTS